MQWIKFFLVGITETSENAVNTLKKILDLKSYIEQTHILAMGKRSKVGMVLLGELFKNPITSVKKAEVITGLSPKSANSLISLFVEKEILSEMTGYQRNRIFVFNEYMNLFGDRHE